MPELTFLWTDILIFILVAVVSLFIHSARKRAHLSRPWKVVFSNKVGISTLIILLLYVVIGLMDSVHYKPDTSTDQSETEMLSLLDYALTDLRKRQEKTYSSPLATHLYSKENIELDDGSTHRDYPRLEFAGNHLNDPAVDWSFDVLMNILKGTAAAIFAWSLMAFIFISLCAKRHARSFTEEFNLIVSQQTEIPWRTALMTFLFVFIGFGIIYQLSLYYHVLGTDKVGEDVLYQALKSIRTGLVIGTLTTLVMLPAAIMLGIMAGYFKGWVDDLIQYTYTTLNSIPGVLLIAAAILMMGRIVVFFH